MPRRPAASSVPPGPLEPRASTSGLRILVVGAGAVGGFLAARLLETECEVTLLVRTRRAGNLRDNGLRVTSRGETRVFRPGIVTADELTPAYDAVILAVKSDALDPAMDDIATAVGPTTVVVPFINGMRHVAPLIDRFGVAVLGGVLRIATQLGDDGSISVLAPMFEVELGQLSKGSSARLEQLAAGFRAAGADVAVVSDIVGAMWVKWVVIASLGAVTSLMRASVGDIVAQPGGDTLGRAILGEAARIADAAGHPVSDVQLAATEHILTAPGSPTTSSLSRDLIAGQPTEVDAVLGDLVDRAHAQRAEAPLLALATLVLRVHNGQLAKASS